MILVTGGTGFVGSHLVPRLAETGDRVRCLVRSPAKAEILQAQGVEPIPGDVTNLHRLEPAMPGVDTVIHLVSVIRENKDVTFNPVNVQGTRNVVQAAAGSGVKRFIYMSVLEANPNPKYRYTYSKWQAEEAVRSSHLDFTIFRPSVMFGQGSGLTDRLIQSLMMFPFLAPCLAQGKPASSPSG